MRLSLLLTALHLLPVPLTLASTFNTSIRCTDAAILPTPNTDPKLTPGLFTICAETIASSSLITAYDAVLDFRQYPAWNTFVVSVDMPSNVTHASDVYIGMPMTFHTQGLLAPLNTTSNEVIAVLAPPGEADGTALAAWKFDDGLDGLLVQAEHPVIFTDLGDGSVRIVSYETYYQLGSIVISALLKENLQKQFEAQAADLKAYLESGHV